MQKPLADPDVADLAPADTLLTRYDEEQGIAECEQALVLDHNLAAAHGLLGMAKYLLGRGEETEAHVNTAFRLSPRDHRAYQWMLFMACAKFQLEAYAEAIAWLRRSNEANRNYPIAHFHLAAALAQVGELGEARAAMKAGPALHPEFTVSHFRLNPRSNNLIYLAGHERLYEGMRMAGVPEG